MCGDAAYYRLFFVAGSGSVVTPAAATATAAAAVEDEPAAMGSVSGEEAAAGCAVTNDAVGFSLRSFLNDCFLMLVAIIEPDAFRSTNFLTSNKVS